MIKFAIIGFGNIGRRHAHFISRNPETELVSVCDINAGARQEATELLGIPTFENMDDMLKSIESDIVCVCTPNYLHCPHTISALEYDRHVLCEKPMCMNTDEADQMIETSIRVGKKVFVVKQNRFNSPVVKAKELIQNHSLGRLIHINVQCYWNRNEAYYKQSDWRGDLYKDGGCLFTQFSHFVDIMYYLVGDVQPVHGMIENLTHPYINTEDNGSFILTNSDGAIITFSYSTCAYQENMEGSISLLGETGSVKIGGKYLNELAYAKIANQNIELISDQRPNNEYKTGYQGSMSHHDLIIDNVVKTLNGLESEKTNAQEGRMVVKIIEDMYKLVR